MIRNNYMAATALFTVMAAMVLTGCANDETLDNQSNEVPAGGGIQFRTVANIGGGDTRATVMDGENIKDFQVTALFSDYNSVKGEASPVTLMNNVVVTRNIGSNSNTSADYTYEPTRYFPVDGEPVDFYAFSPAGSRNLTSTATITNNLVAQSNFTTTTGTSSMALAYTVPLTDGDGKNQEDFLVASNLRATAGSSTDVALAFDHALSKVTFAGKNTAENTTVKITALKIVNLGNTATLTMNYDGSSVETNDKAMLAWSVPTANQTYLAQVPETGFTLVGKSDAAYSGLSTTNEGLMVLPQTLQAFANAATFDAATDPYVEITYGMKDASGDDIYPAGTTVQLPLTGAGTTTTFEPGTSYNMQFTFGAGGSGGAGALNEIQFSVSVTKWDDTSVPLPPKLPVANSYMIHPNASKAVTMNIPLSRINEYWDGNTSIGHGTTDNKLNVGDTWTASILWSDITTINQEAISTYVPRNTGSYVEDDYFTVALPSAYSGGNGNFVVQVQNGAGTTLWSWHIWVTNYTPDEYHGTGWTTLGNYTVTGGKVQSYNGTMWQSGGALYGKVMMDRDLGSIADSYSAAVSTAASNMSRGQLYYQFGRKDPFPTSLDGTNSIKLDGTPGQFPTPLAGLKLIADAVKAPTTFYIYNGNWNSDADGTDYLWNDPNASNTKSIYDPCPAGWRLPLNATWSDFSNSSTTWQASPAGRVYNSTVFYAAIGYRNAVSGDFGGAGGNYWSASPRSGTIGQGLYFDSSSVGQQIYDGVRASGFPVRCVQE